MPTITEEQLSAWTSPAFNNEDERRRNTERAISEAIKAHPLLSLLPIDIYAKGSYKNNTNVRRDSDVDVAVEYTGFLSFDYQDGAGKEEVWAARGVSVYNGPLRESEGHLDIDLFKGAVGEALNDAFGEAAVRRRNKVFEVHESARSLAADVVPCTTHDQHWSPWGFHRGIQLLADKAPRRSVVNYPAQHYQQGVAKNEATARRFKRVVRILKSLENQMVAEGATAALASYLIESLVFNCPFDCFLGNAWAPQVRTVLGHIWENTTDSGSEDQWFEVNGIKYLFHPSQRWTRQEARNFVHAAWHYVEKS